MSRYRAIPITLRRTMELPHTGSGRHYGTLPGRQCLVQPRPCQIVRIRHVARAMIAALAVPLRSNTTARWRGQPRLTFLGGVRGAHQLFCGLVTPLWPIPTVRKGCPRRVDRSGESTSSTNTAGPFGAPCGARSTCQHFGRASLRGGLGTHSLLIKSRNITEP
jgi:hypothetical protein